MQNSKLPYILVLIVLVLFSYCFVDGNFPWHPPQMLTDIVYKQRELATGIYSFLLLALFIWYVQLLGKIQKKQITSATVWKYIALSVAILIFSFPAFSNDIFNYIATARVTFFWKENPYVIMPIELPNESLLQFMHAANKTALYGPLWIVMTWVPHFLGFNNLYATIVTFKLMMVLFYLLLCFVIWQVSGKNSYSLAFFALNPLVIVETLISSHNDVVMMFFALLSFYLLRQRIFILATAAFITSVLVKFATIVLLPVFCIVFIMSAVNKKISWNTVWVVASVCMYVPFLLSPLREEIYAWYLIWVLTFVALNPAQKMLRDITLAFSFGLLFRFAPFIYTREWSGITPLVKKMATFTPPVVVTLYRLIRR